MCVRCDTKLLFLKKIKKYKYRINVDAYSSGMSKISLNDDQSPNKTFNLVSISLSLIFGL